MIVLNEASLLELNKLNIKVNNLCGYSSNDIIKNFEDLKKFGFVVVGYRTSCGITDKTQKIFRIWLNAIKVLEKAGIKLKKEDLLVGNSYATNKGGFWNEKKYSII